MHNGDLKVGFVPIRDLRFWFANACFTYIAISYRGYIRTLPDRV